MNQVAVLGIYASGGDDVIFFIIMSSPDKALKESDKTCIPP